MPQEQLIDEVEPKVSPGAKIVGVICLLAYVLACGIAVLGRG